MDKPLALGFPMFFGYHTRLFAHLACDRDWLGYDAQWFWWPLLGAPSPIEPVHVTRFLVGGVHPVDKAAEVVGLVALALLAAHQRLSRTLAAHPTFLKKT